jgi:hypothetical protein
VNAAERLRLLAKHAEDGPPIPAEQKACLEGADAIERVARLEEAARFVLDQVQKCHFVDDHGHKLEMNRSIHQLMSALAPADAREEKGGADGPDDH